MVHSHEAIPPFVKWLIIILVVAMFTPCYRVVEVQYRCGERPFSDYAWAKGAWEKGFMLETNADPYDVLLATTHEKPISVETLSSVNSEIFSQFLVEGRRDGKYFIYHIIGITGVEGSDFLDLRFHSEKGTMFALRLQKQVKSYWTSPFFHAVSGV